MKKYILIAFLATGLFSATTSFAQYDPKADRKERKIDKKEAKSAHKDEYRGAHSGDKKQVRAQHKSDKMDRKETTKDKYDK